MEIYKTCNGKGSGYQELKKFLLSFPLVVFLIFEIFITGCAITPEVKNLIPPPDKSSHFSINKTLKIAEVKGKDKEKFKIKNKDFQEALIKTLQQYDISITDQNGDYILYTYILSQAGVTLNRYQICLSLSVNYKLVDTKTNQEIWEDIFFSQPEQKVYFNINKAWKKAGESSARDNLSQLVRELSNILK